jgi:hypothetical protein
VKALLTTFLLTLQTNHEQSDRRLFRFGHEGSEVRERIFDFAFELLYLGGMYLE